MLVHVYLDSDESQVTQISNINDINDLDEVMTICKREFKLPKNFEESHYGFKTSVQQILLSEIGDIVKTKKQGKQFEQFMNDKDYYDDNIKADTLILRNLSEEARVSVDFIHQGTKMIQKKLERKATGETKPISKEKQK